MANYYDYIGAKSDATREEIEKAIAVTEIRLKQTGEINTAQTEMNLRNARVTLLNLELREAYNAKLGLTRSVRAENRAVVERKIGARPAKQWRIPHLSRTQGILLLSLLLLIFGTYFGYTRWEASRIWPTGSYLLSIDDGQPEAVILGRVSDHVDLAGRHVAAYQVKMLKTGQITWVTDKPAHAQWQLGNPAPESLLQESK